MGDCAFPRNIRLKKPTFSGFLCASIIRIRISCKCNVLQLTYWIEFYIVREKQTFRLSESSWTSLRCFHASNAIAACLTSNLWLLTSEIISLNSSVQLRCFDPGDDGDPGFRNKLWSTPIAPFSSRSSCWMLPFSIVYKQMKNCPVEKNYEYGSINIIPTWQDNKIRIFFI